MFKITKNTSSQPTKYILKGVFDESVKLASSVDSGEQDFHFYCKEVSRINSLGIKNWRDFFQDFRKKNKKITFHELSPALVSTVNYISDFILKAEIESITAPFFCSSCDAVTLKVLSVDEAKTFSTKVTPSACATCQKLAELDESPEEYFSFCAE